MTSKLCHVRARCDSATPGLGGRSKGGLCGIRGARARLGLPARDLMLELDAVSRRHTQKVGRPPDHIILEFGDRAVGIREFPNNCDEAEPAGCSVTHTN